MGTSTMYSAVMNPAFPADAPMLSASCCILDAANSAVPQTMLPMMMSRCVPRSDFRRSRQTANSTKNAMSERSTVIVSGPRYCAQTLCAEKAAPHMIAASSAKID